MKTWVLGVILLVLVGCETKLLWEDTGVVENRGVSSIGFKHTSLTAFTVINTDKHGVIILPQEELYAQVAIGDCVTLRAVDYWNSGEWDKTEYVVLDEAGQLILVTHPQIESFIRGGVK